MKVRTVKETGSITAVRLPRVGSVVNIVMLSHKGKKLLQPARVVSTHTRYIVCRAIPPEGYYLPEDQMALQTFSKATHHRVRHDGTTSPSEWLEITDAP